MNLHLETRQLGFTEKEQRVGDPHLCTWEMGECLAIQDWCPQAMGHYSLGYKYED